MREMGDGRFSDLLAEQGQRLVSEEKKYQFWQNVVFVITREYLWGLINSTKRSRLSVTLHVARRNFWLNWEITWWMTRGL
jgi:hypothetical protein